MSKQRQVQHRPDREPARGRELSEARKEIRQLKRLVARQQKTIRKLEDERGGAEVELIDSNPEPVKQGEPVLVVTEPAQAAETCRCGATNWATFTTPSGTILKACRTCKARR